MKWLANCLSSLYSSSCTNDLVTSIIPPLDIQDLKPIVPIECKGCDKPCPHPLVPPELKIDTSKPLHNTVPSYAIHIVILTGKTNWPAHIEDEGLARAFIETIRKRKHLDHRSFENRYHPVGCHEPTTEEQQEPETQRVIVTNYALFDYIYGKPCYQAFSIYPCPYTNLILICGHGNKDRRCGTVGPLLQKALEQASLNATKDEGITKIALVSHLGGHAFAGNVVVYTHNGHRAIWYGRVTPCYCKDIVENTLEDDKVIEDLVRGIFQVKSKPNMCQSSLEW
ncbi:Sucrase/ferredoxin-like-domain-containing protein [Mucor lusitanicus]